MIIGKTEDGDYIVAAIRSYRMPARSPRGKPAPSIDYGAGEVLTVICPFCGSDHVHGTCGEHRMGSGDGRRAADCGKGEYIIREIENPYPPDAITPDPRRITSFTRARILERDKFRCRRCGRGPDQGVTLEVDHIVPVARGGHAGESNLQTLCSECNNGKGAREPHEHDLRPVGKVAT